MDTLNCGTRQMTWPALGVYDTVDLSAGVRKLSPAICAFSCEWNREIYPTLTQMSEHTRDCDEQTHWGEKMSMPEMCEKVIQPAA